MVYDQDVGWRAMQRPGGEQPAEPAANDNDARTPVPLHLSPPDMVTVQMGPIMAYSKVGPYFRGEPAPPGGISLKSLSVALDTAGQDAAPGNPGLDSNNELEVSP